MSPEFLCLYAHGDQVEEALAAGPARSSVQADSITSIFTMNHAQAAAAARSGSPT